MCKIKELLVDEKRHIRFGDWKDKEVNNVCYDTVWKFKEFSVTRILRESKFGNF